MPNFVHEGYIAEKYGVFFVNGDKEGMFFIAVVVGAHVSLFTEGVGDATTAVGVAVFSDKAD
ncbi:hypothetical protein MNB_SUP05-SYMBIONT-4-417 [hydrothermal vent metagenome]|uniref:Uncharacterized protein n=1 Tax=hydrothermal vent metagenome TaxID=652676 RepID=A0A1W1DWH6_9ZZZZ